MPVTFKKKKKSFKNPDAWGTGYEYIVQVRGSLGGVCSHSGNLTAQATRALTEEWLCRTVVLGVILITLFQADAFLLLSNYYKFGKTAGRSHRAHKPYTGTFFLFSRQDREQFQMKAYKAHTTRIHVIACTFRSSSHKAMTIQYISFCGIPASDKLIKKRSKHFKVSVPGGTGNCKDCFK